MPGPAQVRSTDAIADFRAAVLRFQERVQGSLDALELELRRTAEWVEHERPTYWRTQLKIAEDSLHNSKLELERCLMMTVAGERPACREQKAAVRDWQRRIDLCREKVEMVRKWQRTFAHELLENRGRIGQMRRLLDNDVPRAASALERMVNRLDAYGIERPPEAMQRPGSEGLAESYAAASPPAVQRERAEKDETDVAEQAVIDEQ